MKKEKEKDKISLILNFIKKHEKININHQKKWRKLNEKDIFGKTINKKIIKEHKKREDKVLDFRMQEEFGPKKRIKP